MRLFCILLFVMMLSQSFAQVDTIKRNAVFLSFEEFKNNTPSIHPINIILKQTEEDHYTLTYVDSEGVTKKYKKRLWAFSDSNDVYIKHNDYYGRLMAIGKICVFRYHQRAERYRSTDNEQFVNTIRLIKGKSLYKGYSKEMDRSFIVDFETGNIYEFKPKIVKKLMKDDQELLNEYNKELEYNQDRDKLLYVRRYNERQSGKKDK